MLEREHIKKNTIYFASDLHLGAPSPEISRERERRFCAWLEEIRKDAEELWLVGDVFDFWFEYGRAVPAGHLRVQGKLAELADQGIKIHLYIGNHDLWYGKYFEQELGATIHKNPQLREWFGRKFYIAHGDGLGPGDHLYKFTRAIFTFKPFEWLFRRLHPNFGIWVAEKSSKWSSDYESRLAEPEFYGEKEFLIIHARETLKQIPDIQHFIFGHRHVLKRIPLSTSSEILYLGDWIRYFSYVKVSENGVELLQF